MRIRCFFGICPVFWGCVLYAQFYGSLLCQYFFLTCEPVLQRSGETTKHYPEVMLNNFNTRLGHSVGRLFASLFPHDPEFTGRRVVTFHNQRDYIFVRHHRLVSIMKLLCDFDSCQYLFLYCTQKDYRIYSRISRP